MYGWEEWSIFRARIKYFSIFKFNSGIFYNFVYC